MSRLSLNPVLKTVQIECSHSFPSTDVLPAYLLQILIVNQKTKTASSLFHCYGALSIVRLRALRQLAFLSSSSSSSLPSPLSSPLSPPLSSVPISPLCSLLSLLSSFSLPLPSPLPSCLRLGLILTPGSPGAHSFPRLPPDVLETCGTF